MNNFNMRKFFHIFFPLLITFINKRLITQVDLIFAGILGAVAISAIGLTSSMMLIDQCVALAILPILSHNAANIYHTNREKFDIDHVIPYLFLISFFLSILGVIVYPHVLKYITDNTSLYEYSYIAVFWLNIFIFPEFFRFTMSIYSNASQQGGYSIKLSVFEVFLKIVLNYFFIKYLNLGFNGIFYSSIIASVIVCVLVFNRLRRTSVLNLIRLLFDIPNIRAKDLLFEPIIKFCMEFFRVILERSSWILMFFILNVLHKPSSTTTALTIVLRPIFFIIDANDSFNEDRYNFFC